MPLKTMYTNTQLELPLYISPRAELTVLKKRPKDGIVVSSHRQGKAAS